MPIRQATLQRRQPCCVPEPQPSSFRPEEPRHRKPQELQRRYSVCQQPLPSRPGPVSSFSFLCVSSPCLLGLGLSLLSLSLFFLSSCASHFEPEAAFTANLPAGRSPPLKHSPRAAETTLNLSGEDLRYDACAYRMAALADGEAVLLVHRNRMDEGDLHLDVVARHDHLD